MTPVFADTHFFLALVNARDESHARVAGTGRRFVYRDSQHCVLGWNHIVPTGRTVAAKT